MQTAQVIDVTPSGKHVESLEVATIAPGEKEKEKALTVSEQITALTVTKDPATGEAVPVKIQDLASCRKLEELLLDSKAIIKEIDAVFDPIIKAQHLAHKESLNQAAKLKAPLLNGERLAKPRLIEWYTEQERIRVVEEQRLQRIAEQEAEERRLQDALAAEESGDMEEAELILDEVPTYVPPPIVPKTATTGSGISLRGTWTFKVENLMQLVKAVAAGTVPLMALQANTTFLGQQARSMKDSLKYPGVAVWEEKGLAAGRR